MMGIQIHAGSASFDQTAALKQKREDFSGLISAATSGDVDKAKSAFASLTANRKPPANSPLAALGTAIESGDTKAVKGAAETLQKARKGHHAHGKVPPKISTVQPGVTTESTSTASATAPATASASAPATASAAASAAGSATATHAATAIRHIDSLPPVSAVKPVKAADDIFTVNILV
jgi:hypothetical protein